MAAAFEAQPVPRRHPPRTRGRLGSAAAVLLPPLPTFSRPSLYALLWCSRRCRRGRVQERFGDARLLFVPGLQSHSSSNVFVFNRGTLSVDFIGEPVEELAHRLHVAFDHRQQVELRLFSFQVGLRRSSPPVPLKQRVTVQLQFVDESRRSSTFTQQRRDHARDRN